MKISSILALAGAASADERKFANNPKDWLTEATPSYWDNQSAATRFDWMAGRIDPFFATVMVNKHGQEIGGKLKALFQDLLGDIQKRYSDCKTRDRKRRSVGGPAQERNWEQTCIDAHKGNS